MANELILVAYSDGRSPVATGDGLTLMVDADRPVVIDVSPDPSTWVPEDLALHRGETEMVGAPLVEGRRWVLMGEDRFGTFRATASAGVSIVESPAMVVVPASSVAARPPLAASVPAARPTSPSADVELPAGEYDGRFAAWVGVIFMLLSSLVLGIIAVSVIDQLDVTATISRAPGATETEAIAGRSGLATSALLIGVSCVLLLAGAALAALEVRARQRRDPASTAAVRVAPGTREKLSAILEQSTRLRAPVALLVAGAAVLGVAVFSQIYWADRFG